jgi:flagellar hook-associated protein 1 FlgK
LNKDFRNKSADLGANTSLKDIYDRMQNYLGAPGGSDDLSVRVNNLSKAIENLAANPENSLLQSLVVNAGNLLAGRVNTLSSQVQSLRSYADNKIATTVNDINQLTQQIKSLNDQIISTQSVGGDITTLEDQRDLAVNKLSQKMDITTYIRPNNEMVVLTQTGQALVDVNVTPLAYTPQSSIGVATTYPTGFNAITLGGPVASGGIDITTTVLGGELKGLIQARDSDLPNLAGEIENFATTLRDQINQVHNQGTAFPPQNSLTGTSVVTGATSLGAPPAGIVRIASVDGTGKFVANVDLNLATVIPATVAGLMAAINAALPGPSGVTASLAGTAPNQTLQLTANTAANGVAIGTPVAGSPSQVQLGGAGAVKGFSHAFGLNDFFVDKAVPAVAGNFAASMGVRSDLISNPGRLARGQLSTGTPFGPTPLPATPNTAVTSGDKVIVQAMAASFSQQVNFAAAGNLPVTTQSLSGYAGNIFSNQGVRSKRIDDDITNQTQLISDLETQISAVGGVNLDEEMANITILQNAYNASAQVLKVSKQMFEELTNIMN